MASVFLFHHGFCLPPFSFLFCFFFCFFLKVEFFCFSFQSDFTAKKLVLDKCKTLDSARAPLWLTFSSSSSSPSTPPPQKSIILKVGDDCRQDMFCLDLLQMLNGIWKEDRLPLSLTSYSCQVLFPPPPSPPPPLSLLNGPLLNGPLSLERPSLLNGPLS